MNADPVFDVPEGFKPMRAAGGMFDLVGPVFARIRDGAAELGFRIAEKHLNPAGICHGGMLATVVDVQLGFGTAVARQERKFYPTINLNCDFLAPAQLGDWVEGRTEVIRATPRMVFANAWLMIDGEPILRANAIMKIPSDRDQRYRRMDGAAAG